MPILIISIQQNTGFLSTEIGKVNEIKTPMERHMLMSDLHVTYFLFWKETVLVHIFVVYVMAWNQGLTLAKQVLYHLCQWCS
jgi:hypothetical protein